MKNYNMPIDVLSHNINMEEIIELFMTMIKKKKL